MTIILALDPAKNFGWAVYDTSGTVSAIRCGRIRIDGKTRFEKVASVRRELPKLVKEYNPEFAVFESPFAHAPQYEKKSTDILGAEVSSTSINTKTLEHACAIAGAVQAILMGMGLPCEEVAPRTWQTIIPKNIRGGPKDRVRMCCDMFQIVGPNEDARDAAVIALWAAGRSQVRKHMEAVSK